MRTEVNSLDLNNFPEEHGKEAFDGSSPSTAIDRFKKKKNGEKDESYKVYECRFCLLKFCKSQALVEREAETLNRARQLVFSNEGLVAAAAHMGLSDASYGISQTIRLGDFQHGGDNICQPFRPVYHIPPTQSPHPPPFRSCIGPSISSHLNPYMRDYDNGRVPTARWRHQHYVSANSNCTCFGVPRANTSQMDGVVAQVVRDNMRGHW
ncbi:Zinc finger protein [Musa troglodytarum]|uniref:Zinc finger protein n=1 Tax=Musa troglodytarum TaxID=320322 RepID=A0A9E7EB53_9LILI|nr:Zinc finger protein [Musa troglodytarum]